MNDNIAIGMKQLCTFLVDGMLYGVDVIHIQEVIRQQEMTPVPLAPKTVTGLINLRGQIVTALDLRQQLGLPPRDPDHPSTNVVIRNGDSVVSLLVDEIGDVVDVDESAFEEPPATMDAGIRHMVLGAYKLEGQLLVFLDAGQATR
jgi:purine-binding chemotaxis protein CheW